MIQFWLDNFVDLFSMDNFTFLNNDPKPENYIKVLNLIALVSIIVGITMTVIKKSSIYFAIIVVVLSLTILIKSNINSS